MPVQIASVMFMAIQEVSTLIGGCIMSKKVSASYIIIIGLMLFALFFGAGNLIFPPMLGQLAGKNVWVANAGFLVTGVGLPLLAITAFVFSGKQNLQSLASRVHPVFGIVFTTILYLAIGPFSLSRDQETYRLKLG